jgi:hypothetical protein
MKVVIITPLFGMMNFLWIIMNFVSASFSREGVIFTQRDDPLQFLKPLPGALR